MREPPWQPRTRQQEGDQTEKQIARKHGGRSHPRSGAGKVKDDFSTTDGLFEVKDAVKVYSIKGSELEALFRRAARQHKDAFFVVYFRSVDLTLTCRITKGKG